MLRATIVKNTDCTTKTIASFVPLRLSIQPASQEFSQASGTMTFNISRIFLCQTTNSPSQKQESL